MHPGRITLLFFLLATLLLSCAKDKEILVEDNTAPPDPTIENIVKENYVNRSYIALLGRKPTQSEFTTAFNTLDQANLSQDSREQMLTQVISNSEYEYNLFAESKALLLDDADTTDIQEQLAIYNLLINDPNYQPYWPIIQDIIDQLKGILSIPADLQNGSLNVPGMHRRMLDNALYDELNMGTLNFVVSCFQNLLQRFPTALEREQGILMVDGFSANLFLENGDSKDDYLSIFLGSDDYFEGRVREVFVRFLFREPGSKEMADYTRDYKNSGDYGALLIAVLSSDEYVGLE